MILKKSIACSNLIEINMQLGATHPDPHKGIHRCVGAPPPPVIARHPTTPGASLDPVVIILHPRLNKVLMVSVYTMDLAAKLLQHYIYITLKNNVIIKIKT